MTQNSIVKEKALVGAFSVITNLRMDLRFKLYPPLVCTMLQPRHGECSMYSLYSVLALAQWREI